MKQISTTLCAVVFAAGCARHPDPAAELSHRWDECAYLLPIVERRVNLLTSQLEETREALAASGTTNRSDFAEFSRVMAQLQEAKHFRDVLESRIIQLKISSEVEGKGHRTTESRRLQ